jgi:ABC-type uncharacterized transport system involved in gliding motility auxiliary subunit
MKEQLKKADLFGLVIIAATLVAWSVRNVWGIYQTIAIVVGALLVVTSIALKAGDIRTSLGRRSARFGINSATSVILFAGILGFVNYLGAQHQKRVDMTSEKIYSLSDESAQVASQVPQDLHIKAFYGGGDYQPDRDLLKLYATQNNKISFEFIDPDKQPQVAQQYQVTAYGDFQNPMNGESFRYGTLIMEMGGKTQRIEKQSEPLKEEDITNALLKIVKGQTKTIYFTEGHGEKEIANGEKTGYEAASKELEKQSYAVKTLNLVREDKIPDDATVVVMAGPKTEPFPNELDKLNDFLQKGGGVYIMLDPPPNASLKDFMKKWSIDIGDNFVVDASGMGRLVGAGPEIPLVTTYSKHMITEKFSNVMTFFPLVRSVIPSKAPVEGVTTEELLKTNTASWAETDMKNPKVSLDESKGDIKGPVSIAVVATKDEGDKKKARLVVFGNSRFAENSFFNVQRNGDLFTNTVTWLAQDENFISIKAKAQGDRPLTMTDAQGKLVSWVVLLLLPGSILATGISVWVKRRR